MYKLLSFLIILTLGLISCKKESNDPANCSAAWATEVSAEMNNLAAAAQAYSSAPTHESCVAYKDAYQDYIDALKPFAECSAYTAQQKADLQAAIDAAEEDLSTLCDD